MFRTREVEREKILMGPGFERRDGEADPWSGSSEICQKRCFWLAVGNGGVPSRHAASGRRGRRTTPQCITAMPCLRHHLAIWPSGHLAIVLRKTRCAGRTETRRQLPDWRYAGEFARQIPGSGAEVLSGVGHVPQLERLNVVGLMG